ncbi:hypothetical protein LVB87_12650 [Lysobacter sp. KIS68-7]|uniref:TRAFAC clade GTPase domain-containing protein n=1 Tax=Lysobacter sp. KIS68-7 TaxID=2904252 RepID=UPI001E31413C|nr:hypothetical protein [Lysobacter sp. KIS68-7]UHQ19024.1 hypothetical protein LVB87_12650 [Lysobacter sp. KIS68-7]
MEQGSDAVSEPVLCANIDCRIAETGRCVEGLSLEACPHYGRAPVQSALGEQALIEERDERNVGLRSARALEANDASRVLRRGPGRVVAIIGSSDSGKTSLIASLYDLFQEGSVSDVEFCRSESLHAFEQACHDARAASRRSVPHMARTPRGEVRFYHLEVAGGLAGEGLSLLLGDRAGEEYREAADDASNAKGFFEVEAADTICVLVDGHRLLTGGRHNLRSEILMILQGMHDANVVRHGCQFGFVLTKLDEVRSSPKGDQAIQFFESLVADAQKIFPHSLEGVRTFQVAASPKSEAVIRGVGVGDLLQFWLGPRKPDLEVAAELPVARRAFGRLTGAVAVTGERS